MSHIEVEVAIFRPNEAQFEKVHESKLFSTPEPNEVRRNFII